MQPFQPLSTFIHFPTQEEAILEFWKKEEIFKKSLTRKNAQKAYTYYDGPPFATGLPHYGHILAGILKDIVPRYWSMKGYSSSFRRFGWDCHGLPVEAEISQALQLPNRQAILDYGVGRYNAACQAIVQRYSSEWKKTVQRIGRWVDMENGYFTMDKAFMQSVWWVFQQLWQKGLIYEGYKVVPYSTGISTPLSNFEAHSNYKEVQDPAITVAFPTEKDPHAFFLAWTTTPWTLPSNLALAIGEKIPYVRVREKNSGKTYFLAETRVVSVFKNPENEIDDIQSISHEELLKLRYHPPFSYFSSLRSQGAFRIILSSHVTTDTGTGVVHMAPAFGEDDYDACQRENIPLVNPVDEDGLFTADVPDYQGKQVKAADPLIIAALKKKGLLFCHETIVHSYPFCWRTDTPLIYRAVSSWFVAVEKIKDDLIANHAKTHWVPQFVGEGRFGNWLANARDWAISRNRFWGTPLPLWKNSEGEVICVGSTEELERLSGKKVENLHMEFLEGIEIPSPTGKSPLTQVPGVLDCWFESGSMPYAQWGYPHQKEHELLFEQNFPAQFIAEGLDQTRGWFYTLMVIGTALFNRAPFENVIVSGLILAEDGKKMSKRLKNYPDPTKILDTYGADALRLYLMDSPAVKAQELRFSETGVKEKVRKILLRWWNAYAFFVSYANIDQFRPQRDFKNSPNLLDQWLLSRVTSLLENTEREMKAYELSNVVPHLLQVIEELTNTYIRLNRKHFWKEGMPEDKRFAYETLYEALLTLSKVMAPFTPFLAETTYQNLAGVLAQREESVHLESYPTPETSLRKPHLEEAVRLVEVLLTLTRNYREKIGVKAKIPLRHLKIIHRDPKVLAQIQPFEPYFQEECNIQNIEYCTNEDDFISVSAKAQFQLLGKRVGNKMKAIAQAIQKLDLARILRLENQEILVLEGERISLSDVEIRRTPKSEYPNVLTHPILSIDLDPTVTPEQEQEGWAREVIRKIQAGRKNAKFQLENRIRLELKASPLLREAIEAHLDLIQKETLTTEFTWSENPQGSYQEEVDLEGNVLQMGLRTL